MAGRGQAGLSSHYSDFPTPSPQQSQLGHSGHCPGSGHRWSAPSPAMASVKISIGVRGHGAGGHVTGDTLLHVAGPGHVTVAVAAGVLLLCLELEMSGRLLHSCLSWPVTQPQPRKLIYSPLGGAGRGRGRDCLICGPQDSHFSTGCL